MCVCVRTHPLWLGTPLRLPLSLTHAQVKGVSHYVTHAAVAMSGAEAAVVSSEDFLPFSVKRRSFSTAGNNPCCG